MISHHFGPSWPEVKQGMSDSEMTQQKPGLGRLPNKQFLRFGRKTKM